MQRSSDLQRTEHVGGDTAANVLWYTSGCSAAFWSFLAAEVLVSPSMGRHGEGDG